MDVDAIAQAVVARRQAGARVGPYGGPVARKDACMPRPLLALVLLLALVVSACGGDDGAADPTEHGGTTDGTREATLVGTFEGDPQLEGGCAWIVPTGGPDAELGEQVQPMFPGGYQVEFTPDLRLVGPDGQVVAEQGDELALVGAPADAMATTCQVGPVYAVEQVLDRTG